MSERVKLADAATVSALGDGDSLLAEHNGAIGRLPLSDGTGVGLSVSNGIVSAALGGSGTVDLGASSVNAYGATALGYVRAVHFESAVTNMDDSLTFFVSQRTRAGAILMLAPRLSAGSVGSFLCCGEIVGAYALNTALDSGYSVDIYIEKQQRYDYIGITPVNINRFYMPDVTLTYPDEYVETLPDGVVAATQVGGASTTSLAVQSLSAGGGTIADTDLLLVKTESGLTGVTLAELKELLKD